MNHKVKTRDLWARIIGTMFTLVSSALVAKLTVSIYLGIDRSFGFIVGMAVPIAFLSVVGACLAIGGAQFLDTIFPQSEDPLKSSVESQSAHDECLGLTPLNKPLNYIPAHLVGRGSQSGLSTVRALKNAIEFIEHHYPSPEDPDGQHQAQVALDDLNSMLRRVRG